MGSVDSSVGVVVVLVGLVTVTEGCVIPVHFPVDSDIDAEGSFVSTVESGFSYLHPGRVRVSRKSNARKTDR